MRNFDFARVVAAAPAEYSPIMSQLTREQFVDLVIQRVVQKFPLVKIARGPGEFCVDVNGQTAPLENLYRLAVLHPGEAPHQVDRWMVELLRFAEGQPDQTAGYEDLKGRIMPLVLSRSDLASHPGIVSQPLLEGLVVAYVVDSAQTVAYIPWASAKRWKVSVDDLHATALANLVQRSETIAAHAAQDENGTINLMLFQTLDGYDGARILLPTLHERLRQMLGSPFAAAVPNRDILLCFRNDEATVTRLRPQVTEDYQRMPHQVTDRLLLVTADGIAMRD